MVLVLQDGFLLRSCNLYLPQHDPVLVLLGPIVAGAHAHGRRERVRICHDHLHHAAEHRVLFPAHEADGLGVVGRENQEEDPALPVELGDG